MARTKQTARVSTGDTAPRGKLRSRANQNMPLPESEAKPMPTASTRKSNKRTVGKSLALVVHTGSAPATRKRMKTGINVDAGAEGAATSNIMALQGTVEPAQVAAQKLSVEPIVVIDFSNMFCYLCQNGGEAIKCDECPRVLCLKHIPQIAAVPEATRLTLHFRCPSCHTIHAQGTANKNKMTPYHGLYKLDRDGKPKDAYLLNWVRVFVLSARPQHTQVNTSPVVILSIRLMSLEEESSPAWLLSKYLLPWFGSGSASALRYIDIPYNIEYEEDGQAYRDQWDRALTGLGTLKKTRLMLFVYTHSHDETGDLFWTPNDCSESVKEWWTTLICPKLGEIATSHDNDLTIAMLTCGALVNNAKSREQLTAASKHVGAKRMFAFGAVQFQPTLTAPFFMNFATRVLIEGAPLNDDNVGTVLDQSLFLSRHTPIWFYSRLTTRGEFQIRVLQWSHLTMRPHGEDIGIQCPECGSLSSRKGKLDYGKKSKSRAAKDSDEDDDKPVIVSCQKPGCNWSATFAPPKGAKRLKLGEKGRWTSRIIKDEQTVMAS